MDFGEKKSYVGNLKLSGYWLIHFTRTLEKYYLQTMESMFLFVSHKQIVKAR